MLVANKFVIQTTKNKKNKVIIKTWLIWHNWLILIRNNTVLCDLKMEWESTHSAIGQRHKAKDCIPVAVRIECEGLAGIEISIFVIQYMKPKMLFQKYQNI